MRQVKHLKPDVQQHVLWLHQEAYSGPDLPCIPCKGGCCQNCAAYTGYIYNKVEVTRLKSVYGWDNKRGFLTDIGCRLPVEERSNICVGFICEGGFLGGSEVAFSLPSVDMGRQIRDLVHNEENYKK